MSGLTTRTVTFMPVTHREQKRGACPTCGKKNTRSRTFEATVNPFNKDPETGRPRTYQQVHVTLRAAAEKWVPDYTCSAHFETEAAVPQSWPTTPEQSELVARGMRLFIDFAQGHGLPLRSGSGVVHLANPGSRRGLDMAPAPHYIDVSAGGAHDLAAWARALECDRVRVDTWRDLPDTTRLRVSGLVLGFEFQVRADYGRRLGAKDPVEWELDYRAKRDTWGHMTVDAVAALPERDREVTR